MALDKLVDSSQLNADLTSIANAIRTKGGTSAQLAFPADFVSAIEAIAAGGGLNYDLRTVNVTSNTPKVDRAFDNFIFFAQIDGSDIPEAASRARLAAYFMAFAYVDGKFVVYDGGRGLSACTNTAGASAIKTSVASMTSTSVGATSITFSTYTSQYMCHGTWHVLQVELPSDAPFYSVYDYATALGG